MASLAHASAEFVQALRRGLAAYDAGDHEQAYDEFSQALDIEPDNVWGLLWKGATAPSPATAAMWLEQALALDPENEHAEAGLAWAKSRMDGASVSGSTQLALPESERLAPDWSAEEAARTGEAEEEADLSWLGDLPAGEEEAAESVQRAEEDEAESPQTEAGDIELASSDDEDLPDWLRDIQEAADDDVPDWLRNAETPSPPEVEADLPDWLSGDLTPTGDEVERTLLNAEEPTASALPDWLAAEETQIDTSRRAEGSLPPSDAGVEAYQAGLLAYEENRLDEALRAFERTVKLDPSHVEAHNYLGSVYFLQGRTDEAVRAFNQALELDPDHAESYLNLGLVYQETNQPAQAIQMFERYLELEPDSSIAGEVQGFVRDLRG
ncbi:MAG: tetratricopeptide repeat protein [Ardenticatenaceae bacterium]|nr:tetratricopeptide repeat protein [Ardenticatenaceae bacterium]